MKAFVLVLWAATALGQTLRYATIERTVIEHRLRQYALKNVQRAEALERLFTEVGCTGDRLSMQMVSKKKPPNVICSLPGESESRIVVGAHFDFVASGHGVVDNWSGAALLPSLYQGMSEKPPRHTIVFVGFTEEEKGLVGSEFYVRKLTKEQVKSIRAMINMDTLGLSSTRVSTDRTDKTLMAALARISAALKLPVDGVRLEAVGTSDWRSFSNRKVPTVDFHSLTQATLTVLHSPKDTLKAMNLDEYYTTYKLISAYLAYLDMTLEP